MKEIKFRFWVDGANGEFMIYPDNRENGNFNSEGWEFYLDDEGFEIINHRGVVEPAHHVPMQYTGLKDKNGAEIYEGDIVETPSSKAKYLVDYVEGSFIGRIKYREYTTLYKGLKVIGNIYEHPELLEVAE